MTRYPLDHGREVGGDQVAAAAAGGPPPAAPPAQPALGVAGGRVETGREHEAPPRLAVVEDVATHALEALDGQGCALVDQQR
jgi:hypothetical protein